MRPILVAPVLLVLCVVFQPSQAQEPNALVAPEGIKPVPTRVQSTNDAKRTRELLRFGVQRRVDRGAAVAAGDEQANKAIERALNWFVATQKADGSWDGDNTSRIGTTGLAMLSFMGYGITHAERLNKSSIQVGDTGHRDALVKAVAWMLKQVAADGSLRDGGRMYDQGIGTYALCEAYGLTGDASLKEACEKAVAFIVKGQNESSGGWRYVPAASANTEKGDLSVSGFQIMAVESARHSGLKIPDNTFKLAKDFLDSRSSGSALGLYGYHKDEPSPKPAMTAVGMFCQQLLFENGTQPNVSRIEESASYIRANLPSVENVNYYYWWYGSYAMGYHSNVSWGEWYWGAKERPDYPGLGTILLDRQVSSGDNAGSWSPEGYMAAGFGRHVTTAFVVLALEVPYRFISIPNSNGSIRINLRR